MDIYATERTKVGLLNRCLEIGNGVEVDADFKKEFDALIQNIILNMLKGENTFFANFIIQFRRQINLSIREPFSTEPCYNYFILHINPILMLQCGVSEIEALLKHEIYHLICLHPIRSKRLIKEYSALAVALAMDVSVNQYIVNLPSWAATLENVNLSYNIRMVENQALESYAKTIEDAIRRKKIGKNGMSIEENNLEVLEKETDYSMHTDNHKTWINKNSLLEDEVIKYMINKSIDETGHIEKPNSVRMLIKELNIKPQISWETYLRANLGSMPWRKKKTSTRLDRRMPDRLDLRGTISHHIANLIVAIDISGSMTEKEIRNTLVEIKAISIAYNTKITILECDEEIRGIYTIDKFQRHISKPKAKGRTRFTPVFQYIRSHFDSKATLIYFTDGLGEEKIENNILHSRAIWVLTSIDENLSLKNAPGIVLRLKEKKKEKDNTLPLEFLKTEMKEIRSEWAK